MLNRSRHLNIDSKQPKITVSKPEQLPIFKKDNFSKISTKSEKNNSNSQNSHNSVWNNKKTAQISQELRRSNGYYLDQNENDLRNNRRFLQNSNVWNKNKFPIINNNFNDQIFVKNTKTQFECSNNSHNKNTLNTLNSSHCEFNNSNNNIDNKSNSKFSSQNYIYNDHCKSPPGLSRSRFNSQNRFAKINESSESLNSKNLIKNEFSHNQSQQNQLSQEHKYAETETEEDHINTDKNISNYNQTKQIPINEPKSLKQNSFSNKDRIFVQGPHIEIDWKTKKRFPDPPNTPKYPPFVLKYRRLALETETRSFKPKEVDINTKTNTKNEIQTKLINTNPIKCSEENSTNKYNHYLDTKINKTTNILDQKLNVQQENSIYRNRFEKFTNLKENVTIQKPQILNLQNQATAHISSQYTLSTHNSYSKPVQRPIKNNSEYMIKKNDENLNLNNEKGVSNHKLTALDILKLQTPENKKFNGNDDPYYLDPKIDNNFSKHSFYPSDTQKTFDDSILSQNHLNPNEPNLNTNNNNRQQNDSNSIVSNIFDNIWKPGNNSNFKSLVFSSSFLPYKDEMKNQFLETDRKSDWEIKCVNPSNDLHPRFDNSNQLYYTESTNSPFISQNTNNMTNMDFKNNLLNPIRSKPLNTNINNEINTQMNSYYSEIIPKINNLKISTDIHNPWSNNSQKHYLSNSYILKDNSNLHTEQNDIMSFPNQYDINNIHGSAVTSNIYDSRQENNSFQQSNTNSYSEFSHKLI